MVTNYQSDVVDKMLAYLESHDMQDLLRADLDISTYDLNVIVINILGWLRLGYKRDKWKGEGKRDYHKPLRLNMEVTWCQCLVKLVMLDEFFGKTFLISNNELDFSAQITNENKILLRKKAFDKFKPVVHKYNKY